MKHLKTFENFDPTNEELKDSIIFAKNKLKEKVSKVKSLKWSDIKSYSSKIWDSVKKESSETKQAAKILQDMISGKDVSDREKKFLKEQSKDLVKIVGATVTPTVIVAVLQAIGKKYNFNIFAPGDQEDIKRMIEAEKQKDNEK